MKMKLQIRGNVIKVAALLGVLIWVLDGALDSLFFYEESFLGLTFTNVPPHELCKPGELTEEEWSEMERHPQVGERIVRQVDRLERAAKIIGQHQEKYDGSGYPNGLEGEEITLEARILAVADAWDAMRSDRPYREALPKDKALKELEENKGNQFDPEIVELLLETIEEGEVEQV